MEREWSSTREWIPLPGLTPTEVVFGTIFGWFGHFSVSDALWAAGTLRMVYLTVSHFNMGRLGEVLED